MSDITLHAAYASVVEDEEGALFIGFAEGEDDSDPYVLIRQDSPKAPIWLEVEEEAFGAHDAIASADWRGEALVLTIAPPKRSKFSFAAAIRVTFAPDCEGLDSARQALADLLGSRFLG